MTTRDRDPVYDKHFEVKRRGLKIFKIFEHVTSCNILKRNTRKSILQRLWCVWHHDDPSMLQGWVTWNRGSKLRLVEPSQTWITLGDRVDIWSLKGFHWFQNNHNTQQLTIFDPYIFGAHFFCERLQEPFHGQAWHAWRGLQDYFAADSTLNLEPRI